MATRRVHFIGGPAHGDDRVIDCTSDTYQVTSAQQFNLDNLVRTPQPAMRTPCDIHVYYIRQVGPKVFVAVHSDIAG